MKFLIVFVALFAFALAAPAADVAVVRQTSEVNVESYDHSLETSDGTKVEGHGETKQIGKEVAVVARGSFSFVADDGQTYTINYIADENGFQPQGAHLPVAPEA